MSIIFPDNRDDPINLDDWAHDRASVLRESRQLAMALREQAGKLGHANALDILSGDVEFTLEQLQHWADQNQAWAQNMLGMYYCDGKNVHQDQVMGNYWFLKAAKRGYYAGQYNIGKSYYDGGPGIQKDWKEAKHWLALSAAQGFEDAKTLIEKLLDAEDEQRRAQEEEVRQHRLAQTHQESTAKQEVLLEEKADLERELSAVEKKLQQADIKIDAAFSQKEEDQAIAEKVSLQLEKDSLTRQITSLQSDLEKIRQALAAVEQGAV